MENAENAVPTPTEPGTLARIESMLETLLHALGAAKPVISLIPGAAPIAAVVEGVGTVVDEVLHAVDGDPTNDAGHAVDAAALAAGRVTVSTGNDILDMRLAQIELLINVAIPVIKDIAKHFGVDTTDLSPIATPVSGV